MFSLLATLRSKPASFLSAPSPATVLTQTWFVRTLMRIPLVSLSFWDQLTQVTTSPSKRSLRSWTNMRRRLETTFPFMLMLPPEDSLLLSPKLRLEEPGGTLSFPESSQSTPLVTSLVRKLFATDRTCLTINRSCLCWSWLDYLERRGLLAQGTSSHRAGTHGQY